MAASSGDGLDPATPAVATPATAGRRINQPFGYLLLVVAIAVSYAVVGSLSLGLAFANTNVTAVWPPTGIAVVALMLWGIRFFPGVALGALAAKLWNGASLNTSALITVVTL